MPRSLVLYTSSETLEQLRKRIEDLCASDKVKPYTLSLAHRTDRTQIDLLRVRLTEFRPSGLTPIVEELVTKGLVTTITAADKDQRETSYEAIMEDADVTQRAAVMQFSSPTIIGLGGYTVCFPVLPLMLSHYIHMWNTFSGMKFTRGPDILDHVTMGDFKVSCVQTEYGAGFQGWAALEMRKGRPEEDIRIFNALLDFAFYCGTGLYTDKGLGQTDRKKQ
jgi:CRISPR-associated endoribonuclease Cas6